MDTERRAWIKFCLNSCVIGATAQLANGRKIKIANTVAIVRGDATDDTSAKLRWF